MNEYYIVEIIKSSKPTFWYGQKIGKIFLVNTTRLPFSDYGYEVMDENGEFTGKFIGFDDCKIIGGTK